MISTREHLQYSQKAIAPEAQSGCDECELQLVAAQKELSAFVIAVKRLFGAAASAVAARCWVGFAESIDLPAIPAGYDWRQITMKAASLVISIHGLDGQSPAAGKGDANAKQDQRHRRGR